MGKAKHPLPNQLGTTQLHVARMASAITLITQLLPNLLIQTHLEGLTSALEAVPPDSGPRH